MKLLEGAQMLIQRPRYIKFLKKFQDTEFIKVITGVRRSGKTYLMNMFIDELLKKEFIRIRLFILILKIYNIQN